MISDATYRRPDLPRLLEQQALDFMRVEWSDGFTEEDRYRSRLHEVSDETVHFLRVAGDLLVSHVQVIPIDVHGRDRDLTLGGVSGVLTYPQFRGEGHATALLHAVAAHIGRQGFDLGMLFCGPEMTPFYERLGWRALPEGRVLVGGADLREDLVMVLGDEAALPDVLDLAWSW